jgi:hypothetical protein
MASPVWQFRSVTSTSHVPSSFLASPLFSPWPAALNCGIQTANKSASVNAKVVVILFVFILSSPLF